MFIFQKRGSDRKFCRKLTNLYKFYKNLYRVINCVKMYKFNDFRSVATYKFYKFYNNFITIYIKFMAFSEFFCKIFVRKHFLTKNVQNCPKLS